MNKEFVPYELALKLNKLEFDAPCLSYYTTDGNLERSLLEYPISYNNNFHESLKIVIAPLFQQAFRWFREKHNLKHHIWVGEISTLFYGYDILNTKTHDFEVNNSKLYGGDCDYDPYERAELACLEKLIEIVENKLS